MFLIFGITNKKHLRKEEIALKNRCPNCSGNLLPKTYKRWFSLFFIPLIPLGKVEDFYECDKCKFAYSNSIKQNLSKLSIHNQTQAEESKKKFAKALIASMTHMAMIDHDYAPQEKRLIEQELKSYPGWYSELKVVHDFVLKHGNKDNYVFDLLNKIRNDYSSEGLMNLIAKSTKVLLADGRIEEEETQLLKEYLIACGLPKTMYRSILEKVKNENF